jgi:hypothetical protein
MSLEKLKDEVPNYEIKCLVDVKLEEERWILLFWRRLASLRTYMKLSLILLLMTFETRSFISGARQMATRLGHRACAKGDHPWQLCFGVGESLYQESWLQLGESTLTRTQNKEFGLPNISVSMFLVAAQNRNQKRKLKNGNQKSRENLHRWSMRNETKSCSYPATYQTHNNQNTN